MSTKSIFAPQYNAQFADATKEIGEVQTISFFLTPRARQERCNALVALLTTMAYLEPTFLAIASSNSLIFSP